MRRRSPARSETACEDVGVAESASICAVCHRARTRGIHSDAGDVFICTQCQADAAQFIAIQDMIIEEARAIEARRNSDEAQHQQGPRG